jgi:hypothetical protein
METSRKSGIQDCKISQKQVVEFYFTKLEDNPGFWKCTCGSVNKQAGSGYYNLFNHIKGRHPSFMKEMSSNAEQKQVKLNEIFDSKTLNIFGWLDWIIKEGLPFCFCENNSTRTYSRLKPICTNTLKKYMLAVTREVENAISQLLPDQFGIILDGWSDDSNHFVGLFA